MRILDRYVLNRFLIVLIFTILGWIVLFVVVDMVEHLDDFLNYDATTWQIFRYYLLYIPYSALLTMPISVLIAILFSLGQFAQHNEMIAMFSNGISFYRVLLWLLLAGLGVSIFVGVAGETFVPQMNRERLNFLRYDIKKRVRVENKSETDIVIKDGKHTVVYMSRYIGRANEGRNVSIVFLNEQNKITHRIDAHKIKWIDSSRVWMMEHPIYRSFKKGLEEISEPNEYVYHPVYMVPEDMIQLKIKPEEMAFEELLDFVGRIQEMGLNARKWLTDLHMKIAYPLANLIVILLGAPLAARKRRAGVAMGIIIGFVITFFYFVIIRIGQAMGYNGVFHPMLAAWLGNLVFLLIGIIIVWRVPK